MGDDDSETYAYVYDSEGDSYETCFYVDEQHWMSRIIIRYDSSGVYFG